MRKFFVFLFVILLLSSCALLSGSKYRARGYFPDDIKIVVDSGKDKKEYSGGYIDPIIFSSTAPNSIYFTVPNEDSGDGAFFLRVYKNKEFWFSVIGDYDPKSDKGKTFVAKIPPMKNIRKGECFFFNNMNLPSNKVLLMARGAYAEMYRLWGDEMNSIYFSEAFLEEKEVAEISVRLIKKDPSEVKDAPIDDAYFCYADVKKGTVYEKTFYKQEIDSAEWIGVKFGQKNYKILKKVRITDKRTLGKIRKLVGPTFKEFTGRVSKAFDLEKENLSKAQLKKKKDLLVAQLGKYVQKTQGGPVLFEGFLVVGIVGVTSKAEEYDPSTFKVEAFELGDFVVANLLDKNDDEIISLLFENKSGKLIPIYPF